ncbi:unnamed protein product [Dibothriocephalus latus]|uniref:Tyrosine-protein phosphatase domain-containing protein n=1 Tax=Dibothriocephalus latus TaxID=60516 RepID=A0A3P7L0B8_DIBLA|nr:unnamed protein product [Dibothriocephalus latus]
MQKNRYSNVFAYPVLLLECKGMEVDVGFHRPKAYIAAQGPMSSTFDDFWQMIWDENCSIIVMISNFVERGKRKCDQYWPSEGQQSYGTISVRMLSETFLACYVIRVFDVKNQKCKKVPLIELLLMPLLNTPTLRSPVSGLRAFQQKLDIR